MGVKAKVLAELKRTLGPTFPDTYSKYEDLFNTMSDQEVKDFFKKKNGKIRLFVDDNTTSQKKVDQLGKILGINLEEKLILPYRGNALTKFPVLGFPIQIVKLQQMATKKNISTLDTKVRDMNNQAARADKTGMLSNFEVAAMAIYGDDADPLIKEMFSPRGDNSITKNAMNEMIKKDLDFSLADLPNGNEGRVSLYHLDANYACMGLATDLIDHIDERS